METMFYVVAIAYVLIAGYKMILACMTMWIPATIHAKKSSHGIWGIMALYALGSMFLCIVWPVVWYSEGSKFFTPYDPEEVKEMMHNLINGE